MVNLPPRTWSRGFALNNLDPWLQVGIVILKGVKAEIIDDKNVDECYGFDVAGDNINKGSPR